MAKQSKPKHTSSTDNNTNPMPMTITRPVNIQAKNDHCTVTLTKAGITVGTILLQPDEVFEYLDKLKEAFELLAKEEVKP